MSADDGPVGDGASALAGRLDVVRRGIREALDEAGRQDEVTTIVVTKFQPDSLIRDLHALGVRDFGESRHQEARAKNASLSDLDLSWHFVGQLQSKKARQVVEYARVIHSVDRESLVDALATGEDDSITDVFVQINLTGDESRGGVPQSDVERMTERVLGVSNLRLLGVMTVAPLDEEPRRAFARLGRHSERVRRLAPDATCISAGMSGDYREAILEGATHLRIGTAITGNRPTAG